jgi:hypothetical protein
MAQQTSNNAVAQAEQDCSFSATTIAALLFLAAKFPHRQFNSSELCVLSGIGRTAMSQIKNAADSPFSLGKCTLQRLDGWLAKHPGFSNNDRLGGCICQKGFAKALRSPVCLPRP